ncbi:DinB superfamily protein [Psychrobacillus sp. OK028]|uniref:DinB family protein n=1 Tax=Psychrobacillus sp. OK028 TaxID=1884359 RepID=UPI000881784E|nr:DinB family protein [Psychrobacillus sp. OK028]SDN80621.1 DinB superfamily protein [Psychrobacillus sp. OK028]
MSDIVNDYLHETRNNLVNEITSLSHSQFNNRLSMNMWSIAQVCHHLVLVEQATIKAIARGLKKGDNTQTERKNVHLIIDRSKKFKAPEIVEPDLEAIEVQSIIELLNDSRKKLLTFLHTIEEKSILVKKSVNHPALGELPLDQWIEQIYLHEQRHIEQIKEIKLLLNAKH